MKQVFAVLLFVVAAQAQNAVTQVQVPRFSLSEEIVKFSLVCKEKAKPRGLAKLFTFATRYQIPTVREPKWKPLQTFTFMTRKLGSFEGSAQNVVQPRRGYGEVSSSALTVTWRSR